MPMTAKAVSSLDDLDVPGWFAAAASDLKPVRPRWAKGLSRIGLRGGELPPEACPWTLGAIAFMEAEAVKHDLIDLLKLRVDPASLDAWMAEVLQAWIAAGTPARDAWVLTGAGSFGGDATVRRAHEAVRSWSKDKERTLAVRGLDVLSRIGSPAALEGVATLSAGIRDHSIADEAQGVMERKAASQGASREQIEDRHVSDCGLDARGERILTYGPRSFRAVLGKDLELSLLDENARKRVSLPPPAASDDRAQAEASRAAWSEIKVGVKRVLKAQLKRFEQAMITGREWSLQEFRECVLQHAIVSRIAQLLLWQTADADSQCLRVTEDLSFANATDESVMVAEPRRLRVAHPLRVAPEELKVWQELFADYRMVQPFQQLTRQAYRCEPSMAAETILPAPNHSPLQPGVLYGILDNDGWRLGKSIGGRFAFSWKRFIADDVTAVISYSGLIVGAIGKSAPQVIKHCSFHSGQMTDEPMNMPGKPIALGVAPVVAFSETMRRLLRQTAEGS
jgi:hypothetical protein